MLAQLLESMRQLDALVLGIIASGAVFLIALFVGVRALFPPRDRVLERLERFASPGAQEGPSVVRNMDSWADDQRKQGASVQVRQMLIHAGLREPSAVSFFLVAKIGLAIVVPALFVILVPLLGLEPSHPLPIALALSVGGFLVPNMWLHRRVRKRKRILEHDLADAMDLLVTCVEAGLGLDAALSRVAAEMALSSPTLAEELKITFLEMQAGMARAEAFRRLAERTGVEDLRSLAATLTQTELFGTSVTAALRVRAEWMRTRRMQVAEERAATVAVKMTIPLVFCILPSLVAIVMGPAIVRIVTTLMPKLGGGG